MRVFPAGTCDHLKLALHGVITQPRLSWRVPVTEYLRVQPTADRHALR
jgi:hypothetical protein